MKYTHQLASIIILFFAAVTFLAFTGSGAEVDERTVFQSGHLHDYSAYQSGHHDDFSSYRSGNLDAYIDFMMDMDMFTLRLIRAIQAEDMERTEETASQLKRLFDSFVRYFGDGKKDIQLTREIMLPALEQLEKKVEARKWEEIRLQAGVAIASCNACHTLTGAGNIIVKNPFFPDPDPEEN